MTSATVSATTGAPTGVAEVESRLSELYAAWAARDEPRIRRLFSSRPDLKLWGTDAFERMAELHGSWPEKTRAAVRDLAWSTLRDYGRGDAILRQLLHTPPAIVIHALLLVALRRLEQRPEQAHTTVDQAVQAAAVAMPTLQATCG